MFCKDCGESIKDETSNFCFKCGTKIKEVDLVEGRNKQLSNPKQLNNTVKTVAIALIAILALVSILRLTNLVKDKNVLEEIPVSQLTGDKSSEEVLSVTPESFIAKEAIDLKINQLDTSQFPKISLYFSALNAQGIPILNLTRDSFEIYEERIINSDTKPVKSDTFLANLQQVPLSVSLILDNSGSMSGNPMTQAKSAAKQFLNYVDFSNGDQVEIIEFNSDVYIRIPYGSDIKSLNTAIDTMESNSQTALYDALYTGLVRAYSQSGPKCILAFTDGEENASIRSVSEVTELSRATSIPIFIIGVGSLIDEESLKEIAEQTGGEYFYSPTAVELEQIYKTVYDQQKEQYVLTYESQNINSLKDWHYAMLRVIDESYAGELSKEYIPAHDYNLPIELLFSSVTASSTLEPQVEIFTNLRFDYLPYHAIDQSSNTAWVEGASGDGIGEWIRIDFLRPTTLSGMYIRNGYWRTAERLRQNNRIKRIRIEFSNGSSEEFNLSDPVNQNFNELLIGNGQRLDFITSHTTSYVKLEILEVYRGDRWRDTCISDILLFR
ncbi:von Willebrand factor, type A [Alkaliphilus metalliredigens QYMF]|uniref:von Willebrand factor, type A n=1 Tax=Alkaliphilus metalliredigens (strain QYMF) TaxID=293826 RepID=A6TP10_ALKMQ|nr:VWA domain-containing protein [Alkaliphilus metalliredigens]ABR47928.1 von Willebrand factor, type A [Alkaliphilus metalliredigens QYMF]